MEYSNELKKPKAMTTGETLGILKPGRAEARKEHGILSITAA